MRLKFAFVLTTAAIAALAAAASRAQDCEGAATANKLSIVVNGVQSSKGSITASLYPDDKTQFLAKNGALKVWRAPAHAGTTQMCIWLKAPGTYAVAVYHDANGNGKFDLGLLGPMEDYGFSRNPRILFSKPSLASVRFPASTGETTIHVRLNRAY
jgi:uncharacterized protein (DUF2141 family)